MERSDKIKKQPSTVQDADGVKHIQLPVEELGKNCDFFTNDDDSNSNGN